ncbi:signal peptidase I [Bifidobacterium amazonense]|uniref:Signal peptidase I n=1 Tax=Bifidobacterium amazonense TaxID=2809027 RepID=A0ABS9VU43_9BIFI|nr:signal peptidase I [Bifidobacterium amazonense]MCH9275611.1 signal peptidase I [Bifidobacterium amazonense]
MLQYQRSSYPREYRYASGITKTLILEDFSIGHARGTTSVSSEPSVASRMLGRTYDIRVPAMAETGRQDMTHAENVANGARGQKPDRNSRDSRNSEDGNGKESLLELIPWIVVPVVVFALIRVFLIGLYVIPSGSMLDTIQLKDRVAAVKVIKPQRGDIVVFSDPDNWLANGEGDDLIKRVIGLPGDTVSCAGNGAPVEVNGVAIDESTYLKAGVNPSDEAFSVTVADGMMWVMGDNRSGSADSRAHQSDSHGGQVPLSDVQGVAVFTFWPLGRMHVLDGHHEVFVDVPDAGTSD